MQSQLAFAFIHSPLVGPFTWSLVADELSAEQVQVYVPSLRDSEADTRAYWQQHAYSVAHAFASVPTSQALVLVGHSGAGPILPAIRQLLPHRVTAYIFVDAGLPRDGASRLDLLATESAALATEFQSHLEAGGQFPEWTEDQLRTVIPDPRHRRKLLDELKPRRLSFFTERIPVFSTWPDAACAYIQFSTSYNVYKQAAQEAGWPVRVLDAKHFHMLVEPKRVAEMIQELAEDTQP